MEITKEDFKKFEKQIILKKIGLNGQVKIKKAKVLIIGIGGLGCPTLLYLASSGVGNIGIVDFDKVEISNLNRQLIFNKKDIGKSKVIQAKKYIKNTNPKTKIKSYNLKISKKNINKIIKNFDIICDGSDNFKTRYLVNDTCLKEKKILISAAVNKFDGHLFKFNFNKKISCFRCYMPELPEMENNCDIDGILPTVCGIMGGLQANEVLKSILNFKNDLSNKILIFNSINNNFRKSIIVKNSKCINKC